MKLIPTNSYDCVAYDVESDAIVLYGLKDGKVIERHVLEQAPKPTTSGLPIWLNSATVGLLIVAVITILAILAILLGQSDIARLILSFLPKVIL